MSPARGRRAAPAGPARRPGAAGAPRDGAGAADRPPRPGAGRRRAAAGDAPRGRDDGAPAPAHAGAAPVDQDPGPSPLARAAAALRDAVDPVVARAPLGPVEYALNPLAYAWPIHRAYLERWGAPGLAGGVEAVLLGMNPGPWGMAQTGVPFGSPDLVDDLLGLRGRVGRPARTHPSRPIEGFEGRRTEVSGQRLWGGVRACFGAPEPFFARFFVLNYCPLVFQTASGANVTPDKAPAALMAGVGEACDAHLAAALTLLRPRTVIGVGKWAADQAARVVRERGLPQHVGQVLHPSPASPAANRGWLPAVRAQLATLGHPWPEPA